MKEKFKGWFKISKYVLLSAFLVLFGINSFSGSGKVFVFDPAKHRWYAIQNGEVINSGVAAGGANYCRDIGRACHTPVGEFRVWSKGGPGCKSSKYPLPHGGAPMPWCMHFTKYYAIHGSNEVAAANISHGCIRVYPEAANWLSHNFIDVGTRVVVKPYR